MKKDIILNDIFFHTTIHNNNTTFQLLLSVLNRPAPIQLKKQLNLNLML